MVKKVVASTAPKKKESVFKTVAKKYEGVSIGAFSKTNVVDVIRTGSLSLDIALGIGGVARGRIFEISGMESHGKTFIALNVAKNAQAMGYKGAFIDTEYGLDPDWAEQIGVKISPTGDPKDGMVVVNVESLEDAGEAAVMLAESGEVDFIIFDSVAGAPIRAVVEGDLGDANMGVRARIMSQFMPKINGPVKRNNVWMLFTNQLRMTMDQYNPTITPGGKALPFHASQRVHIVSAKKEKTDPGKPPSYLEVTLEVKKNKLAPPFRRAHYELTFADGSIDTFQELAEIMTDSKNLQDLGVIQTGAWYTLPPEMLAPGYEGKINGTVKVAEMFASDLDHFEKVVEYVRSKLIKNEDVGSRVHNNAPVEDDEEDAETED